MDPDRHHQRAWIPIDISMRMAPLRLSTPPVGSLPLDPSRWIPSIGSLPLDPSHWISPIGSLLLDPSHWISPIGSLLWIPLHRHACAPADATTRSCQLSIWKTRALIKREEAEVRPVGQEAAMSPPSLSAIPLRHPSPPSLSAIPLRHPSQLSLCAIPLCHTSLPYLATIPLYHTSRPYLSAIPLCHPSPPSLSAIPLRLTSVPSLCAKLRYRGPATAHHTFAPPSPRSLA
jgi:hypothetical protein